MSTIEKVTGLSGITEATLDSIASHLRPKKFGHGSSAPLPVIEFTETAKKELRSLSDDEFAAELTRRIPEHIWVVACGCSETQGVRVFRLEGDFGGFLPGGITVDETRVHFRMSECSCH